MQEVSTAPQPTSLSQPAKKISYRISSIDFLRGLIMIIMALDHVRDYFHADAFFYDPLDLSKTSVPLFFTRWITHFCAPTFMFLSGTSAFLVGIRRGKKYLSKFLLTRGLWLIFLELAVFSFAWSFNIHYPIFLIGVIWALGISMIVLSALIYLPLPWIAAIGLAMVFAHNLLDTVGVPGNGPSSFLWSLVHEQKLFNYSERQFLVAYPVIPWIGVMALGYCLGKLYTQSFTISKRKRILIQLGTGAIILFVLLRFLNVYGDPSLWSKQPNPVFSFLSFLKVSKYPPSLLYLLVTLGPGLLFLAFTENNNGWLSKRIQTIGRVPLFYYFVHLFLIHLAAMVAASLTGFGWDSMILSTFIFFEPNLQGYGFSLPVVYAVWLGLVLILYFLCKWYDQYKLNHKEKWWLSYM